MQTVELLRPFLDWQPGAHHAILHTGEDDAGGRAVLAILGPETQSLDNLQATEEAAGAILGRRAPGVLTLIAIVPVQQRLAWVYEYVDGIGATWLAHQEGSEVLPLGAAAEIVASVAQTLVTMGPLGVNHLGPTPEDLLIDRLGQVHVSSFVSPFARDPVLREPHGRNDTAALVYRLGILLSTLACGKPPVATSDPTAHEAMVRRVLIRATARPGNSFTERYRDWLMAMIAWDADARPPLKTVAAGLREAATGTGDRSLIEWSATMVSELQAGIADSSLDGPYSPWLQSTQEQTQDEAPNSPVAPMHKTLPGLRLSDIDFDEDEPTAESSPGRERVPTPKPLIPRGQGAIPVGVGPPAEAIKDIPRLPSGFLESEPAPVSQEPTEPRPRRDLSLLFLAAVTVVLCALGLISIIYLFVL